MAAGDVNEDGVRTSVYFHFREPAAALREQMPPALSFLAGRLSDQRPGKFIPLHPTAAAEVEVTPGELETTLAWGRTTDADGRTRLKSAFIEDHYGREDLDGQKLVELVKPIRVEAPPVRNVGTAYQLAWTCSRCDRVRARQVGDLDVDFEAASDVPGFRGHPQLLFTPGRELLIARQWKPLLEAHGVAARPLLGTTAYLQVVAPEAVVLRPERPPLAPGDRCPGCGTVTIDRLGVIEGDSPTTDATGLRITREQPLTIVPPAADLPALSLSTHPIDDLVEIHPRPEHRIGEPVPAGRAKELLDRRGWNVAFISEPLLAALWDGGATGLEYRPVVWGT